MLIAPLRTITLIEWLSLPRLSSS